MTSPDFSPLAGRYAATRPGYPRALFDYLASLVDRHELAWDCATGNGQAAVGLAENFDRVVATDISAEQIRHAAKHPRIDYRVAESSASALGDASVDLVTVAAAVHWFDLEAFYKEVRRVSRAGGALAVWTYHVGHVEPPFDRVFHRFYYDVLRPYFGPKVKPVDEGYANLTLPGESADPAEPFFVTAEWDLARVKAFIRSWSGARKYQEDRGEDPVLTIEEELDALWGPPESTHRLRWPLYVRASRVTVGP
jgi:SAM-dependent methyltransferase